MPITKDVTNTIQYQRKTDKWSSDDTGVFADEDIAISDKNNVLKQLKFNVNPASPGEGTTTLQVDVDGDTTINLTDLAANASFATVQADAGGAIVAESADDTATLTSPDTSVTITAVPATDTIEFVTPDNKTNQKVNVAKAGSSVGTRKTVNLIEGTGVTMTVTDNSGDDRVDVTINSTATGTGDVVGPASSVDGEIALFDSTTGKLIKRASGSGAAVLASGVLSAASGSDGQVLTMVAGVPAFAAAAGGGVSSVVGAGSISGSTLTLEDASYLDGFTIKNDLAGGFSGSFYHTPEGSLYSAASGGSLQNYSNASATDSYGVLEMTVTSSGNRALLILTNDTGASGRVTERGQVLFWGRIQIPTLSDGTDTFMCGIGLVDRTNDWNNGDDGIFWYHHSTTSANWIGRCDNGASVTTTASSTAVAAATWVNIALLKRTDGSGVDFYINESLVLSITTDLPSGTPANGLYPVFGIRKTAGTNARSMLVDRLFFRVDDSR